jgi:hypothetical protein
LLLPEPDTDLVKGVLETVNGCHREAAAKVPGGGGIRDAAGAEGIKELDVLTTQ